MSTNTNTSSSLSSSRSTSFRSGQFDPYLISAQIICMQACFYLSVCSLMLLSCLLSGHEVLLDSIFLFNFTYDPVLNWIYFFVFLVNSVFMGFLLVYVVGRSRLALDFSMTLFGIHFCLGFLYNRGAFPWSFSWWFTHLLSTSMSFYSGKRFCIHHELQPISVGISKRRSSLDLNPPPTSSSSTNNHTNTSTKILNSIRNANHIVHLYPFSSNSSHDQNAWPLQNLWKSNDDTPINDNSAINSANPLVANNGNSASNVPLLRNVNSMPTSGDSTVLLPTEPTSDSPQ